MCVCECVLLPCCCPTYILAYLRACVVFGPSTPERKNTGLAPRCVNSMRDVTLLVCAVFRKLPWLLAKRVTDFLPNEYIQFWALSLPQLAPLLEHSDSGWTREEKFRQFCIVLDTIRGNIGRRCSLPASSFWRRRSIPEQQFLQRRYDQFMVNSQAIIGSAGTRRGRMENITSP